MQNNLLSAYHTLSNSANIPQENLYSKRKKSIQEMQNILKEWAREAHLRINSPATFEQAEEIFNNNSRESLFF